MAASVCLPLGFRRNLENSLWGLQSLKEIRELALSIDDTQYSLNLTELNRRLNYADYIHTHKQLIMHENTRRKSRGRVTSAIQIFIHSIDIYCLRP